MRLDSSNFRTYCACIIMKILLPIKNYRHAEDTRSSPPLRIARQLCAGVKSFMCRNIRAVTNADSSTAYSRLLLGRRKWPQTPFSPMLEAGPHIQVTGLLDASTCCRHTAKHYQNSSSGLSSNMLLSLKLTLIVQTRQLKSAHSLQKLLQR